MNRFPWYVVANSLLGEKEVSGSIDNKKIIELFRLVGHSEVRDDEVAWCAAFVGACLELSGYKSNRRLSARSYLSVGEPMAEPEEGCIVVFWRDSKRSGKGHVGFFVRRYQGSIYVLGGNQGNSVSIQSYPVSQLLGYRMPVERGAIARSPLIRNYDELAGADADSSAYRADGDTDDGYDAEAYDELQAAQNRGMIEWEDLVELFAPNAPRTPSLQVGSSGTAVEELQNTLKAKGYAVGAADGKFGRMTEAAVFAFQRANGIDGTGVADASTLNALMGGRGPELSIDRQTKTEGGLESIGSEIIGDARYGRYAAIATIVLGLLGGGSAAVGPSTTAAGSDLLGSASKMLGDPSIQGGLLAALGIAGLSGRRMFDKTARKRVADHRSGMNRGH